MSTITRAIARGEELNNL